tara:strand:- start:76 stop:282 length:207 start_codon:yes stop_codon:yes gene_type:complete
MKILLLLPLLLGFSVPAIAHIFPSPSKYNQPLPYPAIQQEEDGGDARHPIDGYEQHGGKWGGEVKTSK